VLTSPRDTIDAIISQKATPAVKKGFLNNNKKSLYPEEGSSEGQNGGGRCLMSDVYGCL
jgi:hypothetical protein